MTASLPRRLLAKTLGTGLLVAVVIGSGIAAQTLSPGDTGLQLLENSLTTVFGLGTLILLFGPTSGAHFNPVVSAADWLLGRREGTGLTARDTAAYTLAQIIGAILGAVLANAMFDLAPLQVAQKVRATPGLWLGEIVATAGLVALIFTLARTGRAALSVAVGACIGAAYWFTSSTSFANPAVSVVVTVCGRANEELPATVDRRHWSVRDPVQDASPEAFDTAVADLTTRVTRLVRQVIPA